MQLVTTNTSCVYKFADVSIPDTIKTVRVQFIENKAPYLNPQLSPQLTEKLRQKIVSQTRLTQVNSENAHYDISGYVAGYAFSTSAISGQKEATNRLTVTINISLNNQLSNKTQDFTITRNFEFSATKTIPQAEAELNDEMIRSLTDEIFNRIFSDW
jgi:hypothetical protein